MKKFIRDDKLFIQFQIDLVTSKVQGYVMNPADIFEDTGEYQEVIVDISDVKNIDSTGITFIIGLYKTVTNNGKKFRVIGMHQDIYHVFKLIKLNDVFKIELA